MNEEGLAWGTIRAAQTGDEVWIQRAWDADTTNQVISLGRVAVSEEGDRADTTLFASRDVKLLMYGGAVRACGKASELMIWSSRWPYKTDGTRHDHNLHQLGPTQP